MTATETFDPVQHWVELSALEHLLTVVVDEACGEDFQVPVGDGFNLVPNPGLGEPPMSLQDAFVIAIPDERDGVGDPEIDLRQAREMLFSAKVLRSLTPEILTQEADRLTKLARDMLDDIGRTLAKMEHKP